MHFRLSTWLLAVLLIAVLGGSVAVGTVIGRCLRARPDVNRESVGVVQGTLLGLVGLLPAFGPTMAVRRYEARRGLVVQEANDIGTTYLRAQLLAEPSPTTSLDLLQRYAEVAVDVADQVLDSTRFDDDPVTIETVQHELWAGAEEAVRAAPTDTAPPPRHRDAQRDDRHPHRTRAIAPQASAPAPWCCSRSPAARSRSRCCALPLVARPELCDVARRRRLRRAHPLHLVRPRSPQRGFITVPDAPLTAVQASMDQPQAAVGP
jgi:hypothetical protein